LSFLDVSSGVRIAVNAEERSNSAPEMESLAVTREVPDIGPEIAD